MAWSDTRCAVCGKEIKGEHFSVDAMKSPHTAEEDAECAWPQPALLCSARCLVRFSQVTAVSVALDG